jgi:hypothetical protein
MKAASWLTLTSLAGFWLTVGLIGVGAGCHPALAQSPAAARVPPADESATAAQPGSIPQPDDPTPMPGAAGVGDPSASPDFPDDLLTPDPEATNETGLLDLIRESMFAKRDDLWRPLPLRTFFSEDWNEPWSASPRSSTGAPRQAWINAFDGVFYRLYCSGSPSPGDRPNETGAMSSPWARWALARADPRLSENPRHLLAIPRPPRHKCCKVPRSFFAILLEQVTSGGPSHRASGGRPGGGCERSPSMRGRF